MPILTRSGNQTEQRITFILALAELALQQKVKLRDPGSYQGDHCWRELRISVQYLTLFFIIYG